MSAHPQAHPHAPPMPPPFGPRIVIALLGVLLASLVAGLNEHVTEVAMADIRGGMGIGHDDGTWLTTAYEATQVAGMLFAPWFAVTFSMRRFIVGVILAFATLGILCPFAPDAESLILLRATQGLVGGCLPPMLMSSALRFLPPGIKLYGLGAYALTATFGPNLGVPLAALWTEVFDWRFAFWQVVPFCAVAAAACAYGLPQDPIRLERFHRFDWPGLLTGFPAICMIVVALMQADRLDGFNSPLIVGTALGGAGLFVLFLVNEWSHALPFIQLRLLRIRNFSHALITLAGVLVVLSAVGALPSLYLGEVWGYRPLETTPLALMVALPQLVALPLVAALLNIRWIDCRWVLATGLVLIALSCLGATQVTSDWSRENFYLLQLLQVFGQPMAVIPLLMQATGSLTPTDGPFASAMFNSVKGLAAVIGTAVVEGLGTAREHLHSNTLLDRLGNLPILDSAMGDLTRLGNRVREQALVLTVADIYGVMAVVALALIVLIPVMPVRVYPPRPAARPAA
ncbi:MAG: MFS transporter [Azospirillaceae bacterium]|nr:MFS transporter [Azospirillaceae bacterium]